MIEVRGELTSMSGGDGDDTLTALLLGGTVNGDAGGDVIRVQAGPSDPIFVDGGVGADRIDATGSQNVVARGGAGDDVIRTNGMAESGAGYAIVAKGGAGNDTLSHALEISSLSDARDAPVILRGGDGAGLFQIALTNSGGPVQPNPDGPETYLNRAGVIADFAQGVDRLDIDFAALGPEDDITARMGEDAATGTPEMILSLSGSTLPDQDVLLQIGATGLDWADFTSLGRAPVLSSG